VYALVTDAYNAFEHFGFFNFLTSSEWSYTEGSEQYGALPFITGTLMTTLLALVFCIPFSLPVALFVGEYFKGTKVAAVLSTVTDLLAGIPSIIYGLFGSLFFCQFMDLDKSLLAGALTLVIMNLPTIMRTTQESLKTVPQSYREGAFGLGAGKWRVIRTVVLPNCVEGVITGCILSVGRIVGESAALLFTAGFAHALGGFFESLSSSGATLTVALYVYATEEGNFEVAFAIAAILMILTLLINLSAMLIGKYFERKSKA
jgi:phosphate transport system permease protein